MYINIKFFRREYADGRLSDDIYFRKKYKGQRFEQSSGIHHLQEDAEDLAYDAAVKIILDKVNETNGSVKLTFEKAFNQFKALPLDPYPREKQMAQKQKCWMDFAQFIMETTGKMYIDKVTPADALDYLGHLQHSGLWNKAIVYKANLYNMHTKQKKVTKITYRTKEKDQIIKLAPTTRYKYRSHIEHVYRTIFNKHCADGNPFQNLDKQKNVYSISKEYFNEEQLKLLGKYADPFNFKTICTIVNTGLRKGDFCNLFLEDVDLKDGYIEGDGGKRARRTGDYSGSKVRIPILPELEDFLGNHIIKTFGRKKSMDRHVPLFPEHYELYRKDPNKVSKLFINMLLTKEINIYPWKEVENRTRKVNIYGIHTLRHTFAYLAAISDPPIPLPIIKAILGHSSSKVTEKIYLNHVKDHDAKHWMFKSRTRFLLKN